MKEPFYVSGKQSLYGLVEYCYNCALKKEEGSIIDEDDTEYKVSEIGKLSGTPIILEEYMEMVYYLASGEK